MSEKLYTPKFRLSFPQLFEPKGFQGGKEKYSAVMLFDMDAINKDPKEKAKFKAMKEAMKESATQKWPKGLPKGLKNPFRKGEEKEDIDGYGEGIVFVRASTEHQPGVVDDKGFDIMKASEVYAGCYAHATVNTFAYDTAGNRGIAFGLQNLQKLGEGEPFGNRSTPEQDFGISDAPADDGGDDDLDDMFE